MKTILFALLFSFLALVFSANAAIAPSELTGVHACVGNTFRVGSVCWKAFNEKLVQGVQEPPTSSRSTFTSFQAWQSSIIATRFCIPQKGGGFEKGVSAEVCRGLYKAKWVVALPSKKARGRTIEVCGSSSKKCIRARVLDVGPWNEHDDAYVFSQGRIRPQAESGTDRFGRRTNKAGIDLLPQVAEAIDARGSVNWRFV